MKKLNTENRTRDITKNRDCAGTKTWPQGLGLAAGIVISSTGCRDKRLEL